MGTLARGHEVKPALYHTSVRCYDRTSFALGTEPSIEDKCGPRKPFLIVPPCELAPFFPTLPSNSMSLRYVHTRRLQDRTTAPRELVVCHVETATQPPCSFT